MKKKILIIGLSILVVLIGIGITYAYFSAQILNNENTSTIISEAGTLSITLNGGNSFTASAMLPGDSAWATKEFTITGNNTSKGNMPYNIKLVVDNNTFSNNAITYSLTGVNTSNSGVIAPSVEYVPVNNTKTIGSGFFEKGNSKVHTYTISLYFLDTGTDQSGDMRATFNAHIEIEGTESEKPAPAGWWKASSETLLGAIRDNSVLHTDETGMTRPGQDIADTNEQLRITLDDYGESFYFRGAVTNNYVVFANKCWKIVRITGNGAIKLFLWNNNGTDCTQKNNAGIKEFIKDDVLYNNNGADGYVYKTASGIGFMYGEANPTGVTNNEKYLNAQANIYNSTILTYLKSWYDSTFTANQKEILADVIWCNDKSVYSGLGYGTTSSSYFSARKRIYANNILTNANPSLVCPNAGSDGKLSKFTSNDKTNGNAMLNNYKLGLVTADEAAFAGARIDTTNNQYFLYTGSWYWTMTPCNFNGINASVYTVGSQGRLWCDYVNYATMVRPSVSLKSDTLATYTKNSADAPGTVNNPYIISVPQAQS